MEFWEKFLNCAINKGVSEEHARWYVNWGVRFAKSIRGVPLKERSLEDVRLFLDDLAEREDIGPWQVEQARKALRMLYEEHLGIDPKSMPKTRKGKRRDRIERPYEMQKMHGKLLKKLENRLSVGHYSPRTKESYISWVKRFISFHGMQSPSKMDAEHIKSFLEYLAIERRVSSSTQNQALNAIVFLFSRVIEREPGDFSDFVRAKMPLKKPASLSRKEALGLIDALKEPYRMMAILMYGSGFRIMECLRLQIRDIDFDRGLIHVRAGKGAKDRYVMLPSEAMKPLKKQVKRAKKVWEEDRAYDDSVEPGCQFVFPSDELKVDAKSRRVYRAHRNHNGVRKAFEAAGRAAGLRCRVTPHLLRHTFATHLYEDGWHIQTIQDLLGHAHMSTTMIYTHPMNHPGKKVVSPLDILPKGNADRGRQD